MQTQSREKGTKKGNVAHCYCDEQMLVKSNTIAVAVPEFPFVLLLNLIEEVGTVLMLSHQSISIENRLPPIDRIVPLQASLSCNYDAAF